RAEFSGPWTYDRMNTEKVQKLTDVEQAVDAIIARVGKTIAIGLPLGLGKPVELINALFQRALRDPSIQLRILTALSLEIPTGASALEKNFLAPFIERVFGGVPELDYMKALRSNTLPKNIVVSEFFFKPGSLLDNKHAQEHYVSSNYSHAARDVFNQGCNVAAQTLCKRETETGTRYSLSCNPDTTPELLEHLRASGRPYVALGLINQELPYMGNDAEVDAGIFDFIIDHPRYSTRLFSTPKLGVATPDYMIGLHASALVKDGGTLQVGIGALGDAIVHSLLLRHQKNPVYRNLLKDCGAMAHSAALVHEIGGDAPFEKGLYGASEMLVDGFMPLHQAGILKREVFDFWALQQLINEGRCDPQHLHADVLLELEKLGVRVIRTQDFRILQHHGFFNDATRYDLGYLVAPDGQRFIANIADPISRKIIADQCLGQRLRNGIILHGGFFLGPQAFYDWLRKLSEDERRQICMTGVNKVNQLDLNPRLYKAQRIHARFMNTGIMVSLSGAVCSDGLADGRVISGVGGQYNFVSMAHQLPTGRSVLMFRAVRDKDGTDAGASSNVVFNYGNCTIPRHLRDIVITEYGIAELRSRSDSDVAKALLNITDSRFQQGLLDQAKKAGKIEAEYQIPEQYRRNIPQRLEDLLQPYRTQGIFPAFPFGTDLTPQEQLLGKALKGVKARAAKTAKWKLALAAWRQRGSDIPEAVQPYLQWLKLDAPHSIQDKVVRMLLVEELRASGKL
ncbi:MAG TPA: acetyl-CoA hydrolase/transferase C-terminal domain-containing protein, partial [Stenotrophobium sp.]|nr:acetyl-CoA hydrolase/transferase C-terminal domain-containing protein [Stenotrophobium sp.]